MAMTSLDRLSVLVEHAQRDPAGAEALFRGAVAAVLEAHHRHLSDHVCTEIAKIAAEAGVGWLRAGGSVGEAAAWSWVDVWYLAQLGASASAGRDLDLVRPGLTGPAWLLGWIDVLRGVVGGGVASEALAAATRMPRDLPDAALVDTAAALLCGDPHDAATRLEAAAPAGARWIGPLGRLAFERRIDDLIRDEPQG